MDRLTGTWKLVRLNLRLDRIKLPVVIIATVLMSAASMPALVDLYQSQEARVLYASSSSSSVAARVMGGPIDGPFLGSITMVELFLFTSILISFIATSAVVRHTRQNEEFGRTELTESYPVGRYSQLVAALIVACGAVLIIGILFFLAIVPTEGLTLSGSLVMSAALVGVGVSFAFIAAIIVQLTENSRTANGLCAFAVGIAFILRGLGDGLGDVSSDGLSVMSEWPVWLSPIGWGQQTHPFTQENWHLLSLFFVFSVAAGILGIFLVQKRDKGLAIFASRLGPAVASKRLRSNLALSWRLQRTVILGWFSFFAVFGAFLGIMAKEFEGLFRDVFKESDFAESFFAQLGNASFEDVFFSAMYQVFAIVAAGYTIHALTKIRSEEAKGHLEIILASSSKRLGWIFSHIFWTAMGILLLFSTIAITSGISHSIISDGSFDIILTNLRSMFSLLPATFVVSSVVILIYGLLPRATLALSWSAFAVVFFIMQLGDLLKLPQMIVNVSPFVHLPQIPIDPFEPLPFFVLLGIGLSLYIIGLFGFTRRDIGVV